MENLFEYEDHKKLKEYKADSRREIDLDLVRNLPEYDELKRMGVNEITSDQQELNSTLKFSPTWQKKEKGFQEVFYTIHPTGIVRRYNPPKDNPELEGSGNDIKTFSNTFRTAREYRKALRYLIDYFKRKKEREDFR